MESKNQNVGNTLISPRFKSAAAMAGWDEEALLLATLIVEDTPDRDIKHKKRFLLKSKSPPTNSSRKRRAERISKSIPVPILNLDEEETPKKDSGKKKREKKNCVSEESKVEEKELTKQNSSTSSALPCYDKLREELSCAICLEICYEPSTTPCGHSFCKKCLRSAADKCGKKCPKCRQLIGNGRSCTINTVLWNTIQLLFPQEVEARKLATTTTTSTLSNNNRQASFQSKNSEITETSFYNQRNRSIQPYASSRSLSSRTNQTITIQDEDVALARRLQREFEGQNNNHRTTRAQSYSMNHQTSTTNSVRLRTRRGVSNQDEDAAMALRLQREEFMHAFRNGQESRANLRAMASRAMNERIKDRRI